SSLGANEPHRCAGAWGGVAAAAAVGVHAFIPGVLRIFVLKKKIEFELHHAKTIVQCTASREGGATKTEQKAA
ncbi:unnamed protein product, partial [Urochloa humidicola]